MADYLGIPKEPNILPSIQQAYPMPQKTRSPLDTLAEVAIDKLKKEAFHQAPLNARIPSPAITPLPAFQSKKQVEADKSIAKLADLLEKEKDHGYEAFKVFRGKSRTGNAYERRRELDSTLKKIVQNQLQGKKIYTLESDTGLTKANIDHLFDASIRLTPDTLIKLSKVIKFSDNLLKIFSELEPPLRAKHPSSIPANVQGQFENVHEDVNSAPSAGKKRKGGEIEDIAPNAKDFKTSVDQ